MKVFGSMLFGLATPVVLYGLWKVGYALVWGVALFLLPYLG